MRIYQIVAMNEDRIIGVNGKIPWHEPYDLKRFKELTLNHTVIMGRKTYESIGKPLPMRNNIVITRQGGYRVDGATVRNNIEDALDTALALTEEVYIIGGQEIYEATLPIVDCVRQTIIYNAPYTPKDGDEVAYYPDISMGNKFGRTFAMAGCEHRCHDYGFYTYVKVNNAV